MFKQWFQNLKQTPPTGTTEDFIRNTPMGFTMSEADKEQYIEKFRPADIEKLKFALVRARQERTTPTRMDFEQQLEVVLRANSAAAHQRLLGVREDSEMSVIIQETLTREVAKLRFMVYEDINVTPEIAEAVYQQYLEGHNENN